MYIMIYLYTSINNYSVFGIAIYNNLLNKYDKKDIKIVFNLNFKISKNDKIIPIGIKEQYNLYKNLYTENIYEMLDDKKKFYGYLNSNNYLLKNIKLIPSYDEFYKGKNNNKKYIIKHKNGKGSSQNKIIEGHIYDIIEKYNKDYQIQDIITIKYVYGVNTVCESGTINGISTYSIKGELNKDMYVTGFNEKITNYIKYDKINYFVTNIIKILNYTGFIELEFLIDNNKNIYIMECNPRISGDVNFSSNYYNNLIYPYLNKNIILNNKKYKTDSIKNVINASHYNLLSQSFEILTKI